MYQPGTPQHEYHVKHYGGPEKFGYKDFIPMFTGARFDADEWAGIFKDAGAEFAGPVAEHHDGFSLWNTKLSDWNAVNMGPKRDVVGLLEQAVRKQGMKYMTAFHHAENWFFFPHWVKEYDASNPRYSGLYGEPHNLEFSHLDEKGPQTSFAMQDKPSNRFLDIWLGKVKEVIDNYKPDLLWFDFGLRFVQEHYKREMLAYYYNAAQFWGKEVALTYKDHDMAPGNGVVDIELGGADVLRYNEWITDSTLDDGSAWGYMHNAKYKTSDTLIKYLVDNVSKNGYMLLNVGPKADGTIPDEAKAILREMGRWLRINGEAIYGTTPWMTFGEGPTKVESGAFKENSRLEYTASDIRFTCKGDALYAILFGWPEGNALIETCKCLYPEEIDRVTMLGHEGLLQWKHANNGLEVEIPKTRPCDSAYVVKIERKRPFSRAG
jgi:alpha-L-fucosidase